MDHYIEETVKEAAKLYNWPEKYSIYEELPGMVVMEFSKCHIILWMDELEIVRCSLFDPVSNQKYSVFLALPYFLPEYRTNQKVLNQYLHESTSTRHLTESEKTLRGVVLLFEIIHKFLMPIVNGDFSWIPLQKKFEEDIALIGQKVGVINLESHPVYHKLLSGDPSWKTDLSSL